MQNQIVSPNPVLNLPRQHEDVAMDTIYSSVPAVDDGSTAAQFFIGQKSNIMEKFKRPLCKLVQELDHFSTQLRNYGAGYVRISCITTPIVPPSNNCVEK